MYLKYSKICSQTLQGIFIVNKHKVHNPKSWKGGSSQTGKVLNSSLVLTFLTPFLCSNHSWLLTLFTLWVVLILVLVFRKTTLFLFLIFLSPNSNITSSKWQSTSDLSGLPPLSLALYSYLYHLLIVICPKVNGVCFLYGILSPWMFPSRDSLTTMIL